MTWEGWQEPALEDQLLHLLLPFPISLYPGKMYKMILCQYHMPTCSREYKEIRDGSSR